MKEVKQRKRKLNRKRVFLVMIVLVVVASGLYSLLTKLKPPMVNATSIVVLAYHHMVSDEEKMSDKLKNNAWTISTSEFEEQLQTLYDDGYKTATLEELYSWYKGELELPEKTFVVTFDDGYLSDIQYAVPILEKFDYSSAMFIIGWKVRDHKVEWDPNTLQTMTMEDISDPKNKKAMSFYSHTYALHNYIKGQAALQTKTKQELLDDFEWSKKINSIDFVAYPFGASSETYIEVEKEVGVKLAFEFGTNRPVTKEDNPYLIPRYCIKAGMPLDKFKEIFPLLTSDNLE